MHSSPKALHELYKQVKNIEIIDIGVNEWLDSIDLEWSENRDPADRMIVAYALKHHLPIVTSDNIIKQFTRK